MPTLDDLLVVAVSSRALFDFEAENIIYERDGDGAYERYQLGRLDLPAHKGVAFDLASKLLSFNTPTERRVEVVVLSRNDPVSGLRVFKSAEHHSLPISRGVFVSGSSPYPYLRPLQADLFLSASSEDVKMAIQLGVPAARVFAKSSGGTRRYLSQVRVAFDGDSVLFSDEAERVYQSQAGLVGFHAHEREKARIPLAAGPMEPFLRALHALKSRPSTGVETTIRTALVTARDAPAHERALRTLLSWDVKVDEAFFLGGLDKSEFLREFEPDFFFDDQLRHCEPASEHVATGHVNHGVMNEAESGQ
jgi:5'-nucleotidase